MSLDHHRRELLDLGAGGMICRKLGDLDFDRATRQLLVDEIPATVVDGVVPVDFAARAWRRFVFQQRSIEFVHRSRTFCTCGAG